MELQLCRESQEHYRSTPVITSSNAGTGKLDLVKRTGKMISVEKWGCNQQYDLVGGKKGKEGMPIISLSPYGSPDIVNKYTD